MTPSEIITSISLLVASIAALTLLYLHVVEQLKDYIAL